MNGNFPLLLSKINEFTRKFYLNKLLRGLIYASAVLLLLYLLLFILVYYLHPGVGVKTFLFFFFVLVGVLTGWFWVLRPALAYFRLSRTLSIEEAATLIGDHFFSVRDKLLNTLQLKVLADQHPEENALILAGIEQKITELRPVPFSNAIRLQDNKRYLKYVAAPISIILLIALAFPAMLSEGTYSLVRYDKEILPKAPFNFELLNKSLSVVQGDDLDLQLSLSGNELPQDVYVVFGENTYKLKRENPSRFSYSIKNIQQSKSLRFSAGGFESPDFVVEVMPRAALTRLSTTIDYPRYLNRKREILQNAGDMVLPEGSRLNFQFSSENSSFVLFRIDNAVHKLAVEDNRSAFSAQVHKSVAYGVIPVNSRSIPSDSLSHYISIVPDAAPNISVTALPDSLSRKALYFTGRIADDYGFTGLRFHYEVRENGRLIRYADRSIPIKKTTLEQSFFHFWNLNDVIVGPGQVVEYYFEVADNDGVNGAKKVRSPLATYRPPSIPELLKELEKGSSDLKEKMAKAINMAGQVEKESKKIAQGLLDKKQLSFDDKKQIDALLEKRKTLEKTVEEIRKLNEKNSFDKAENQAMTAELAEKQKQIDDLFNNVLDEKTKALLEQLQKLMEQGSKDHTRDELSTMQMDNKTLKNELDRILELYKQLEFEQNLQSNIDQLKEMAKSQKELSKPNKPDSPAAAELKTKQQELSKQFDELKKSLQDLEQKNNALERPNSFEVPKDEIQKIKERQLESERQLDKNQKEKARESQGKAAEEMQNLANKMENMHQQAGEMEANINARELRRLLENLLSTSFDQEKIMLALKNSSRDDFAYTQHVQKQGVIKDNMKTIGDSLYALSKRVPQIESAVNEEMQQIRFNIDQSLEHLGERRTQEANKTQQYAMTSVNNLALMLSEALEQLQNNRKKGGKGKGKQGVKQLQQMQQELNKKMQDARNKMQEHGNKGTVPKGKMSEEFARMAQEQQMIREALQKLNQQENKDGSGKLGDLNKAIQDMKKTETELVNKRLEQETLNRQKDVLTKLLDAEKAEREQDQSEKRESKTGMTFPPSHKEMLEKYNEQKKGETEWLQKLPPDMNYYYKNKITEYFKLLNLPR